MLKAKNHSKETNPKLKATKKTARWITNTRVNITTARSMKITKRKFALPDQPVNQRKIPLANLLKSKNTSV